MKVVILCGGKGTRLREETEYRPKPMVPVGDMPLLWHIMKIYSAYGHKDFILCLGYKGSMIKDFFHNYQWSMSDVTLQLGRNPKIEFHDDHQEDDWRVTLADTGQESMTGYRIRSVRKFLQNEENFMLTYGDGVGNVQIDKLVEHHLKSNRVCTLTGVHPPGRFGELSIDPTGLATGFNEKPQAEGGYINGGFMVCNRRIFDYLPDNPNLVFERTPLERMTHDRQLSIFKHEGFWQPMDTFAECTLLNTLWSEERAPWKVWGK